MNGGEAQDESFFPGMRERARMILVRGAGGGKVVESVVIDH